MELGKYLLGFTPTGEPDLGREPDLKPLSEFRASLAYLSTLPAPRLEQLLTGTLDLCSHRLDAWITSFATKRLTEIRAASPTGTLVRSLRLGDEPQAGPTQAQAGPVPGEKGPIVQSTTNPGFVHTPSLTQAATVAVLRSGHLAHSGEEASDDLLAIDLSSQRVRLASWLLEGVRQGQPLGALLGYRFERRLQEARLARFVARFHDLAPLVRASWNKVTEQGAEPGRGHRREQRCRRSGSSAALATHRVHQLPESVGRPLRSAQDPAVAAGFRSPVTGSGHHEGPVGSRVELAGRLCGRGQRRTHGQERAPGRAWKHFPRCQHAGIHRRRRNPTARA